MNELKKVCKKIRMRIEKRIALKRITQVGNTPLVEVGINTSEQRNTEIVVSLTTFPARIGTVHQCIKSLLLQTVKPDKIILYLGDEVTSEQVSDELKALQNYGLTIVTGCKNIRPHKKYFFAMQTYPDAMVITVDDDIIYENTLVEDMLKVHVQYPKAVVCRRANIITRTADGNIADYYTWPACDTHKLAERFDLLPTGAGGVLYPPHCIAAEAFDMDAIEKYCLNADDVWLRFMGVRKGTPVVFCAPPINYLAVIPGSQEEALYKSNVQKSKNDEYISIMENHYGWSIDGK